MKKVKKKMSEVKYRIASFWRHDWCPEDHIRCIICNKPTASSFSNIIGEIEKEDNEKEIVSVEGHYCKECAEKEFSKLN